MELLVLLGLVSVVSIAVHLAGRRSLWLMAGAVAREEADAKVLAPLQAGLGGRSITRGWNHVRSETSAGAQTPDIEIHRYVATVRGLLPGWVAFGWSSLGASPSARSALDKNDVLLLALFDEAPLARLPAGMMLVGSRGELTLESADHVGTDEHWADPHTHMLVALAASFLARGEASAIERLGALACSHSPGRCAALRVLARKLPEHDQTHAALAHARTAVDPLLRAIAATTDGPSGLATLRALAREPQPAEVVEEIVDGLLAGHDTAALVALAEIPPSRMQAVAEALGRRALDGATPVLVRFLDARDPDTVEAAAMALARVGTREAVEPLQRRLQQRKTSPSLAAAIQTAVELIQERLGGLALRGGLSLADGGESEAAGRLSLASGSGGEVALIPRDDDKP